MTSLRSRRTASCAAAVVAVGAAAAVSGEASAAPNHYTVKNLVADQPGKANITDPIQNEDTV